MLHVFTGRNRLLAPALVEVLRHADEGQQLIVVPKQLTLQTERMLLEQLKLRGSFRLQVLSAQRLCERIFEQAGQPEGARIDDRGRVMLVRAAVRAAEKELTIYRGAEHRRGFPERAAKQLERIRQANVSAETLRACAAEMNGSAAMKLNDLSYILESYESLIEGRYQDGETEFAAAIARASDAAFLRESEVWFFGFDMMPPTLHALIAAVAAVSKRTGFFLPLENDENARDFDAFLPMQHALKQICLAARRFGAAVQRIDVEEGENQFQWKDADARAEDFEPRTLFPQGSRRERMTVAAAPRKPDMMRLERELFAFPAESAPAPTKSVQLTLLRNPLEECMFAAALARRLVMRKGWHWRDVLILCRDIDTYNAPLHTAFAQYGVPLFLSSGRAAARHATAECLLTALRCVEKNYPPEDMIALLHTGLMPITADEADRLANYSAKYALRGARFLHPLRRGTESEIAALEPLRERFTAPLIALRDALKSAADLDGQLTAIFEFLTQIGAYEKSLERMQKLADAGLREAAGEEGQVWNRILGALDQMHALMGTEKLTLSELRETLSESLSASIVKPLPQSDDAVYAQSTEAACPQSVKAILILGAADRAVVDAEGLLTPAQKQTLSNFANAYLGPDDADLSRLRRFYLKSAMGMASEYVSVSCPLSGMDGTAQRPSAMLEMIAALFPGLKVRGGVSGDPSVEQMLRGAPEAALGFVAKALSGEAEGTASLPSDRAALAALSRIPEADEGLRRLGMALNRAQAADSLTQATARSLYGALTRQSVTQLEMFAACPFSYYTRYGLHPEVIEPFELNARDEGVFFHSVVNEFLLRSLDDLGKLDADTCALRMDAIADAQLDRMQDAGPLGDSAVSRAQRRRLKATARTCALALNDHMRGSLFHTAELERDFGRLDGERAIRLPEGCTLEGRIDRIDAWEDYLRVIDYKRGGKALKLSETYYGLRLQLPIYLAAALARRGGYSAGVYYFTLSEGILATQSTDPNAVEAERRKAFRMEGLLPEDLDLLTAMSPQFSEVVKARLTTSGTLYKGTLTATEQNFRDLTRCALRRASEHVANIRRGVCAAAPAHHEHSDPCQYCDYRTVCLFDPRLDAARIRNYPPLSGEEVLEKLALTRESESEN